MPPPPVPHQAASSSVEGAADSDNKHSIATPLASTIGAGKQLSHQNQYLNNRVFLLSNYRLIVPPQKFDVLKTDIMPPVIWAYRCDDPSSFLILKSTVCFKHSIVNTATDLNSNVWRRDAILFFFHFRTVEWRWQAHHSWWQNSHRSVSRVPPWAGVEVLTSVWPSKGFLHAAAVAQCQEKEKEEEETGRRETYDRATKVPTESQAWGLYVWWWGEATF